MTERQWKRSHLRGSAFFGCQVVEWPDSDIDSGSVTLVHEGEMVGEIAILGFPSEDVKRCVGMLEAVADELLI